MFHQCVDRYQGDFKVKKFSCLDQYLCLALAQRTYRESLRDIESCLRAQKSKLYHMGIRSSVSRNNLSNANKVRDWRIYADLAGSLIQTARKLYANESFGVERESTVYALDILPLEAGAFYVMDRCYLDFTRLYNISQTCAFFVTRGKSNLKRRRVYSQPVYKTTGVICD